jgi:hypothetical protein
MTGEGGIILKLSLKITIIAALLNFLEGILKSL